MNLLYTIRELITSLQQKSQMHLLYTIRELITSLAKVSNELAYPIRELITSLYIASKTIEKNAILYVVKLLHVSVTFKIAIV